MNSTTVLSLNLYSGALSSAIDRIEANTAQRKSTYICAANVHMSVLAHEDEDFREIVNSADMVVPDGRPLFWMLRVLGQGNASQIRGRDLLRATCELANRKGIRLGFYGGADENVLKKMSTNLGHLYPNAKLVYFYSPPFRELNLTEMEEVRKEIIDSGVEVLFVGIGCPKQERWMAENSPSIKCTMVGVGAVFDFVSGVKKHAPKFVQIVGLEWLFRLGSEPKRLWKRYLIGNSKFVFYVLSWLISRN